MEVGQPTLELGERHRNRRERTPPWSK